MVVEGSTWGFIGLVGQGGLLKRPDFDLRASFSRFSLKNRRKVASPWKFPEKIGIFLPSSKEGIPPRPSRDHRHSHLHPCPLLHQLPPGVPWPVPGTQDTHSLTTWGKVGRKSAVPGSLVKERGGSGVYSITSVSVCLTKKREWGGSNPRS